MIYEANAKGPFHMPGYHDPEDSMFIRIILKPKAWIANTVYSKSDCENFDICIPSTFTGLYYKVKSPGISGATEPTWITIPGEETIDGDTGLIWEACLYNLMPVDETITGVTYEGSNGATVTSSSFTDEEFRFMIDPLLPADPEPAAIAIGYFDITATVSKSNTEQSDITIRRRIGDH